MDIDWKALGTVSAVGILAAVVLVALFAAGVAASTRFTAARAAGGSAPLALAGAALAFTACAASVAFGLALIAGS